MGTIDDVDVYKELLALKGKVDTVKEFTVLVLNQRVRLRRMLKVEDKTVQSQSEGMMSKEHKDLSSQIRKEIKVYGDLLEKLANIQMKTGALRVAPKTISGEFTKDGDKETSKITFKIEENFMEHLADIEGELGILEGDLLEIGIDD